MSRHYIANPFPASLDIFLPYEDLVESLRPAFVVYERAIGFRERPRRKRDIGLRSCHIKQMVDDDDILYFGKEFINDLFIRAAGEIVLKDDDGVCRAVLCGFKSFVQTLSAHKTQAHAIALGKSIAEFSLFSAFAKRPGDIGRCLDDGFVPDRKST